MNFWALRVDVCLKGQTVPILSHVFFGDTRHQVDESLEFHRQDDAFLDACLKHGQVRGVPVSVVKRYIEPEGRRKAAHE